VRKRRIAHIGCIIFAAAIVAFSASADDSLAVVEGLKKKQGYLLVHTDVGRKAANWKLNSQITIKALPLGEDFWLLVLRAGKYHWQEIDIPSFDLPHRFDVSDDPRWAFKIEPGVINYAGTLVVGEKRSQTDVSVRYLNRSAEIRAYVQENMPAEYARYGFVYAGLSDDRFLRVVNE